MTVGNTTVCYVKAVKRANPKTSYHKEKQFFFTLSLFFFFLVSLQDDGLPQWLSGKESACNAGATGSTGSTPGWGRPPGGGHGNSL